MSHGTHLNLQSLHLIPGLNQNLETFFTWLETEGLTDRGGVMDAREQTQALNKQYQLADLTLALPTHRIERLTQDKIKQLKADFQQQGLGYVQQEAVWQATQSVKNTVRTLEWKKLPADAMAFYRPFHYPPFDQWGIYLLIEPLLKYHQQLQRQTQALNLFSAETLMHLVVFEIFNHEFFHHLTESTASSLEIIMAATGKPQPVYLNYRKRLYETGFDYPHAPLEEALANAYAYNALGFISRVKTGYKTAVVRAYQQAVKNHWQCEPAGYCDAEHYIGSDYVAGGAHLLAQLMDAPKEIVHQVPLARLAKSVMPSGFTAFIGKPDIPTYLVGSADAIKAFNTLVPAVNEAYTQLFWPYDTSGIDAYVQQKKKEEKERRQREKELRGK